ncbi:MAG: hypothetical protein O2930_10975 [Acidobacteria bacterium]|nr:hypothetical protein [Acidobacteriota bacterium]
MAVTEDPGAYCRAVEAYLCRKNGGHLIRIVGPAFEQVCGWAARGIALPIVFRGIDRYFERYYAKGPRRRPARVEFCEADILDVFDEWRRAVGVGVVAPTDDASADDAVAVRKRASLPAHLDRVVARLTALRSGGDQSLNAVVDEIVREVDTLRGGAKGLRGAARDAVLERLGTLDERLLAAARADCDASMLDEVAKDADDMLVSFRDRMSAEVYARSRRACIDRLIRERVRLPIVTFE